MVFKHSNSAEIRGLRKASCLVTALFITLAVFTQADAGRDYDSIQHFKMISNVEYTGQAQFRNQSESMFTVRKDVLPDGQVQYTLSTQKADFTHSSMDAGRLSLPGEISFVIDRETSRLSGGGPDMAFSNRVNNACVASLKKVGRENIGQTWEQSFELSRIDKKLPDELKFKLKAIQVRSDLQGDMIAVRAVSEPFSFQIPKDNGEMASVKCRAGAVYLFDNDIEDIYMSISVFDAKTNVSGFDEKVRNEVATYKTDADGVPVDLTGLSKEFEKFAKKVGLKDKGLEVKEKTTLPYWAQSKALYVAEVANICASTACEGAINPVATVFVPVSQVVKHQGVRPPNIAKGMPVSKALASAVPGIGAMKIALGPTIFGLGLTEAAIGGGIAGGTVAIAAHNSDDSSNDRSPGE